jgi:hypothetical protein
MIRCFGIMRGRRELVRAPVNLLLPARLVSQMAASAKQGSQDQGESGATENGFLARSWLG